MFRILTESELDEVAGGGLRNDNGASVAHGTIVQANYVSKATSVVTPSGMLIQHENTKITGFPG
jgi:hypothetical protein